MPLAEAALSLRLARQTRGLMARGLITGRGCVRSDDHLITLLLFADERLTRLLLQRYFVGFSGLSTGSFQRLAETLYSWLTTGGSAKEIARHLHLHPQTVRYRLRQLEGLFGEHLHDPQWRFTMQLALHAAHFLPVEDPKSDKSRPEGQPPSHQLIGPRARTR